MRRGARRGEWARRGVRRGARKVLLVCGQVCQLATIVKINGGLFCVGAQLPRRRISIPVTSPKIGACARADVSLPSSVWRRHCGVTPVTTYMLHTDHRGHHVRGHRGPRPPRPPVAHHRHHHRLLAPASRHHCRGSVHRRGGRGRGRGARCGSVRYISKSAAPVTLRNYTRRERCSSGKETQTLPWQPSSGGRGVARGREGLGSVTPFPSCIVPSYAPGATDLDVYRYRGHRGHHRDGASATTAATTTSEGNTREFKSGGARRGQRQEGRWKEGVGWQRGGTPRHSSVRSRTPPHPSRPPTRRTRTRTRPPPHPRTTRGVAPTTKRHHHTETLLPATRRRRERGRGRGEGAMDGVDRGSWRGRG